MGQTCPIMPHLFQNRLNGHQNRFKHPKQMEWQHYRVYLCVHSTKNIIIWKKFFGQMWWGKLGRREIWDKSTPTFGAIWDTLKNWAQYRDFLESHYTLVIFQYSIFKTKRRIKILAGHFGTSREKSLSEFWIIMILSHRVIQTLIIVISEKFRP